MASQPTARPATAAWDDIGDLQASPDDSSPLTPVDAPGSPTGSLTVEQGAPAVTIHWAVPVEGVESLGVVDGALYVTTDVEVLAIAMTDGSVRWRHQSDDYFSDGGSMSALEAGEVRVVAPFNADLRLDLDDGSTIAVAATPGDTVAGFRPTPTTPPANPTVDNDLGGAVATGNAGTPTWTLRVTDSGYYEGGPVIEHEGVVLVPASDGYLYAIAPA